MTVVPEKRLEKIEFYEAHIAPWTTNATAIGLTGEQVTALDGLTTAARNAYDNAVAARQASKTATQAYYDAVTAMHAGPGAGQDMIDTIRNYAQTGDDPNVYTLAEIPPPATPSAAPPPGTPFDFNINLLQDGSVRLNWKCDNPSGTQGTVYEVLRQDSGESTFTFVGAAGSRTFTDGSIPAGAAPVTYRITAVRSTLRGNPAQFTVSFGAGGDGEMGATFVETAPAKLAA